MLSSPSVAAQRRWWGSPGQARVHLLLAVGVAGLAFRFWLAKNSIGCNDADLWKEHADLVATRGVRFAYEHPELESMQFNHPPLIGYYSVFARWVSGSEMARFAFWMKLPGLLTETMAAVLIWTIWSKRDARTAAIAFAAYGACPALILVSGFHCNTDCAYAGLTLLSFYLMREREAPLLSGLALAAALNVKILPLLLVPPLLAECRSWQEALRFSLGAAAAVVPFLPFLLTVPDAMYRNMIAYNSLQLEWGIYAFLSYANQEAMLGGMFQGLTDTFLHLGRYLVLGGIVTMSLLTALRAQRRHDPYQLGAAAWAFFLVLTPGYSVQYSVLVLPLLFATDVARAALYGLLAGTMLLFIYGARLDFVLPLHGSVQYWPWPKIAVVLGVLAWAVLLGYLVKPAMPATLSMRPVPERGRQA
jgi:hypothetical protein